MLDALHKIARIARWTEHVLGAQVAPDELCFAEIVVVRVVVSEDSWSVFASVPYCVHNPAYFLQVAVEFVLGEVCRLDCLFSRLAFNGLVHLRAGKRRPQFSQDRETSDKGYCHALTTLVTSCTYAQNDGTSGAVCVHVRGLPSLADYVAQQRLSSSFDLQDMHIGLTTASLGNVTPIQVGEGCLLVVGTVPVFRINVRWAVEVSAFHKCEGLTECKVDLVLFEGNTLDMRDSLCVFLDGAGHFPCGDIHISHRSAEDQRTRDERISKGAAQQGFNILRIHMDDMPQMLPIMELAWGRRARGHGCVFVSQRWNMGAHREPAVKC